MKKILLSPALHMAVIGVVLFLAFQGRPEDKPQIVVPAHRLAIALQSFTEDKGRLPTRDDVEVLVEALVDDEILYHYALTLGMHEHPAAQRRLAKIAEFVETNPHGTCSQADLARNALDLGLHHGDLVVRRILVDSARRLIRSVVLLQEPSQESLEAFLAANHEAFRRPARVRISHITVNGFVHDDTEARATELLTSIERQALDFDMAMALTDPSVVEASLPTLTEQGLATRFGLDFANAIIDLPAADGWVGPVPSRYGDHLVYVHERHEAYVPPLGDIHETVKQRVLHQMADDYLDLRLEELRLEFDIVTPARTPPMSRS
ncbi:MAG: peptidyl-prolyl cis-trans isomerase [Acidobacteriota bacterium]